MTETVIQHFERVVAERGDHAAMRFKSDGAWHAISWRQYGERVAQAARGLMHLGVAPGDGVAIIGFNRPEWFIADLAAIAAGGVPAGIYTTCTADQCAYIAGHCGASVVVAENTDYLERLLGIRDRLPAVKAFVLMEGDSEAEGVYRWDELLALSERVSEAELRGRIEGQGSDDLCTLIYTSGTTGPPKAVMLSHRNIVWTAHAVIRHLQFDADSDLLSYLPLSHIAEQMVSLHGALSVGACSWFAESLEKLAENLREVRPHVFFAVPRVWEKIQAGVAAAGARSGGLKRRIAAWARRKGLEGGYADQRGERRPALYGLADRLVFSQVRRKIGLDRARICAVSAAPIALDTLEFFLSVGIPILEIYGMSECTGPTTFSTPERYRTGRAGFAIPGTELKIASDGEICMRGPHVFLGYLKDEQATRETLDGEGWIHSGDIGQLDDDGFLQVTDRKKELLITSGGKNVAPAPIEAKLKTVPSIALATVIGDRRNYLTALVTLDPDRLPAEAAAAGSPARDVGAAAACEIFRAYLARQIEAVNDTLARYETIKRFRLLPNQFSIDGGELTPTMKLKRRVIYEKYAREIEALYEGG